MAIVDSSGSREKILLQDEGLSSARSSMYNVLRSLIRNNMDHFRTEEGNYNARILFACTKLELYLNEIEPLVESMRRFAYRYDLDPRTPGNGYRSFIVVVDACVLQCIRLCRHICLKRSSFIFRTSHYCNELEAYTATMTSLKVGLEHLHKLSEWSQPGSLFPDDDHPLEQLLKEADSIDQRCFYGRCLAFQFCESMKKPLLGLSILMASFSDGYYNSGNMLARTASSILNCGRYVLNPEERAERVVDISQRAGVDFCKSFWLLQEMELVQQLPAFVCPPVLVNKVFSIKPVPLEFPAYEDDRMVEIPIPTSHLGMMPINCRLLSSVLREGQMDPQDEKPNSQTVPLSRSPYLIIQCHGGGFVAQSSKSHEVYLRDWARQLNVPIFCIDYSLAPAAPYPRALEECLYAYAWALLNAHKLGTTAEKVVLVGDSAGGNLMVGLIMKTIELEIRKPDAILAIYPALYVEFIPSPSRLLCLMDPMLPFGFMMRCLKAYIGNLKVEQDDNGSVASCDKTKENDDATPSVDACPARPRENNFIGNGPESNSSSLDVARALSSEISQNQKEVNSLHSDSNVSGDADFAAGQSVAELSLAASKILRDYGDTDDSSSQADVIRADSMTTISLTPDEEEPGVLDEENLESDNDYLAKFLKKYSVQKEGEPPLLSEDASADGDENILFEMPTTSTFTSKLSSVTSRMMTGISNLLPRTLPPTVETAPPVIPPAVPVNMCKPLRKLGDEFKRFRVPKDPYLSPYLASDEVLLELPPISILTLQLDPCLDDSVMFCKRLRKLGKEVHFQVLDKLPHGFLSFSLISKDAYEGSKVCVEEIKKLLHFGDDTPSPSDVPSYLG